MSWEDPRIAKAVQRLVDKRVAELVRQQTPAWRYATVVSVDAVAQVARIRLADGSETSVPYWGTLVAGQRVRIVKHPSGDRYVEATRTPDAASISTVVDPATDIGLTSVPQLQPDGTLEPAVTAEWTPPVEGRPDGSQRLALSSYEVEVERVLETSPSFTASASGTGGTLAAGDYTVYVTGVGIAGPPVRHGYAERVKTEAPSAQWRMNEASGDIVDRIGGVRATPTGTVTYGVGGALSPADPAASVEFTNVSDSYFDAGDVFAFQGQRPFSVAFWVYNDGQDDEVRLLDRDDGVTGWWVGMMADERVLFLRRDAGGYDAIVAVTGLSVGAWSHVVATYDGATMQLFVNGASATTAVTSTRSIGVTGRPLCIGGGPGSDFDGRLQEVAIWERPLSAAKAAELYGYRLEAPDSYTGGETRAGSPQTVTLTAGQRLYVNIDTLMGCGSYRVYAERGASPRLAGTTVTTGVNVEVAAEPTYGPTIPNESTAVAFLQPQHTMVAPGTETKLTVPGMVAGAMYGVRMRTRDVAGNVSEWSDVTLVTAAPDDEAPGMVDGVNAVGGYRLIGVRWNPSAATDLSHYEVRYTPQVGGLPDTESWVVLQAKTTMLIVDDLPIPETTGDVVVYYVQVRAVDLSGNVRTSALDATPVQAMSSPEAGWSNDGTNQEYLTAQTSRIMPADVAFETVIAEFIRTETLSADVITAGTLTISGENNTADWLLVRDAIGNELLSISQYGLIGVDPFSPGRAMRWWQGRLEFCEDFNAGNPNLSTWTTSISYDGIVATTITLGSAPGGHNSIPNSGFELTDWTIPTQKVWSSNLEWESYYTATGSPINVDTTTSSGYLKMTTYS